MELVLPNNYVALEQEEMMYLDGGDPNTFARNIGGLLYQIGINAVNRASWGIPSTLTMAKWGYATAVYYFPGMVAKLAALTGNPIVVGLAALGALAGANYLWNNRVFY
ncbi:TPA: hypothetical protein ACGO8I_000151 [Streptococcus suis]|uniref:hypothetical protein n=1 Tax=Streptococcus suis TaxID=1307 RepID=UPI001C948943|nr:hypothetical protein [Streptococcus suis]MBY5022986.1 hypothetical protein [Streptococcus suis]